MMSERDSNQQEIVSPKKALDKITSLSSSLRTVRSDLSLESDYAIRRLNQSGERLPAYLFYGETGSGKGALVNWFYNNLKVKTDRHFPYRLLSCSNFRGELLSSELFGIDKGVATGVDKRPGRIAAAKNGFLFLDEIDKAPPEFINSLLTWLDRGEFNPVGNDEEPKESRAIVACAMVGEPSQKIGSGEWNSDFVFRFNEPVHIPPLRENKDDIVPLGRFFAERFIRSYLKDDILEVEISRELGDDLKQFDWPGNIREVETEIEKLVKRAFASKTAWDGTRLILTKELLGRGLAQQSGMKNNIQQKAYYYTPPSSLQEYTNITKRDFERAVLSELKRQSKGKERDRIRKRIERLPRHLSL